ncbi:MAG: transcription elongation factor GreA [Clostridia bacterium]|nr:transcription elongation factor GreA [Clostridia bacterium]
MAKPIILTPEGFEKLEKELEYLKVTGRKDIAEKIKIARGFGDLSENAEYDAAKDAQAAMEKRIGELEEMIKNAQVVDVNAVGTDTVSILSKVTVYDVDMEEEETYTIVGTTEADPDANKISDESPIGTALLGKKKGDIVTVETPGGSFELKIVEISK